MSNAKYNIDVLVNFPPRARVWKNLVERAYHMGGGKEAELLCRGIRTLVFPGCTRNNETRTRTILAEARLVFVAELARLTEHEALALPRLGPTGFACIKSALGAVGLSLGSKFEDWEEIKARCDATEKARCDKIARDEAEREAAAKRRMAEYEAIQADPVRREAYWHAMNEEHKQKRQQSKDKLGLPDKVLRELRAIRAAVARDQGEPTVVIARIDDEVLADMEGDDGEVSLVDGVSLDGRAAIAFSRHDSERWRPRGYLVFERQNDTWSRSGWYDDVASAVLEAVRTLR